MDQKIDKSPLINDPVENSNGKTEISTKNDETSQDNIKPEDEPKPDTLQIDQSNLEAPVNANEAAEDAYSHDNVDENHSDKFDKGMDIDNIAEIGKKTKTPGLDHDPQDGDLAHQMNKLQDEKLKTAFAAFQYDETTGLFTTIEDIEPTKGNIFNQPEEPHTTKKLEKTNKKTLPPKTDLQGEKQNKPGDITSETTDTTQKTTGAASISITEAFHAYKARKSLQETSITIKNNREPNPGEDTPKKDHIEDFQDKDTKIFVISQESDISLENENSPEDFDVDESIIEDEKESGKIIDSTSDELNSASDELNSTSDELNSASDELNSASDELNSVSNELITVTDNIIPEPSEPVEPQQEFKDDEPKKYEQQLLKPKTGIIVPMGKEAVPLSSTKIHKKNVLASGIDKDPDKEELINSLNVFKKEYRRGNISKKEFYRHQKQLNRKIEALNTADRIKKLQEKKFSEKPLESQSKKVKSEKNNLKNKANAKKTKKKTRIPKGINKKPVKTKPINEPVTFGGKLKNLKFNNKFKVAIGTLLIAILVMSTALGSSMLNSPSNVPDNPMQVNSTAFSVKVGNNTTNTSTETVSPTTKTSTSSRSSSQSQSSSNTDTTSDTGTGTGTDTTSDTGTGTDTGNGTGTP